MSVIHLPYKHETYTFRADLPDVHSTTPAVEVELPCQALAAHSSCERVPTPYACTLVPLQIQLLNAENQEIFVKK